MADEEPTLMAEPTPGWSNAPADAGISSREPAPIPIDMGQGGWSNNGPATTGATAGIPGTFTPAGADSPDKLAELTGVTATPATAWTTGQYVLLGDGSKAHWSGTAWVIGAA
jgi:hypothetical protein